MRLSDFLPGEKILIEKGQPTRYEKIPAQRTLGGELKNIFHGLLGENKPNPSPTPTLSQSPIPSMTPTFSPIPQPTMDTDIYIDKHFGSLAGEAREVLKGENARRQTGVEVDIPNRINPQTGKWDDNAPIKKFKSPFPSLGTQESIDRGLFRINNQTFQTFLADKRYRPLMYQVGIIDNPHESWTGLNKDLIQKYWDRMLDPETNTKMAKLIYDIQGWNAWFAAPDYLKR